jgi:hypothetical protein
MTEIDTAALFICKRIGLFCGSGRDHYMRQLVRWAIREEAERNALPLEESAARIIEAALADERRGECVNRFWFEDRRWRYPRLSPAEKRQRANMAANARVQERFRAESFPEEHTA